MVSNSAKFSSAWDCIDSNFWKISIIYDLSYTNYQFTVYFYAYITIQNVQVLVYHRKQQGHIIMIQ